MSLIAATPELPLYLQMSRYTKGSKAVMELRTERFLAEHTAQQSAENTAARIPDDEIITGSIDKSEADGDEKGFSFDDFLDTINPLQHLPVISTLYRDLTGDQIDPAARIIGGAIFGGPLGAGLALADSVLEEASGATTGAHVMSWLTGDETDTPQLASIAPTSPERAGTGRGQPVDNTVSSAPRSADQGSEADLARLPSLSPEAFRALLTPTPEETAALDITLFEDADSNPEGRVPPRAQPVDISAAMSAALDLYAASKQREIP